MSAKCKPKRGNHGLGPVYALLNLFGAFRETEDEKHLKLNAEYFDNLFQKYQLALGIRYDAFFTPDVTLLTTTRYQATGRQVTRPRTIPLVINHQPGT